MVDVRVPITTAVGSEAQTCSCSELDPTARFPGAFHGPSCTESRPLQMALQAHAQPQNPPYRMGALPKPPPPTNYDPNPSNYQTFPNILQLTLDRKSFNRTVAVK